MLWYQVELSPGTKKGLWYQVFYPMTKIETFNLCLAVPVGKPVPMALSNRV